MLAGHAQWPFVSLAAQERVWCGSWGIAGRFSTANSATDLLHERGSSFKIVMLQLVFCNVCICYLV